MNVYLRRKSLPGRMQPTQRLSHRINLSMMLSAPSHQPFLHVRRRKNITVGDS